jgi:hypothetical protein
MKKMSIIATSLILSLVVLMPVSAQLRPSGSLSNNRLLTINVSGGVPQELFINNVKQQVSSYPYKVQLPIGVYTIVAKASGFKDLQQEVKLNKDTAITLVMVPSVSVPIQPPTSSVETYSLQVLANVAGAVYFINNRALGAVGAVIDLSRGTYQLRVSAPGYSDHNETIVLDRSRSVSVFLNPVNFTLTVNSNVPGAEVSINGSAYGLVGSTITLGPGTYQLVVSANGYGDYTETFQMNGSKVINANLKPAVYMLSVTSNIRTAQVYVNGLLKASVGMSISLPAGPYQVRVSAPGYADYEETLVLTANRTINAQLQRMSYVLTINSNIQNSQVYLNNRAYGGPGAYSLEPGTYQVRVSAPGYVDFNSTITLNQSQTINAQLNALNFDLSIGTDVQVAQIFINDGLIGSGAAVISLAPGAYTIKIIAPGFALIQETIQVSANTVKTYKLKPETGRVVFMLDRRFKSTIYIDNVRQKENVSQFDLTRGMHVIRLVADGGLEAVVSVNVESGKTITITPTIQLKVE